MASGTAADGRMSSILFMDECANVAIVDIPASIAEAHGLLGQKTLSSSPALTAPFPSTEPKSDKAREKVVGRNPVTAQDETRQRMLSNVGLDLMSEYTGPWCMMRIVSENYQQRRRRRPRNGKKQLDDTSYDQHQEHSSEETQVAEVDDCLLMDVDASTEGDGGEGKEHEIDELLTLFRGLINNPVNSFRYLYHMKELQMQGTDGELPTISNEPEMWSGAVISPLDRNTILAITDNNDPRNNATFYLPSDSTVILGSIQDSSTFRNAVKSEFADTTHVFNFILLDPPWPNRSVKRSSPYTNITYMNDLRRLLQAADLDTYIAPGGYVGVWVTNKPAAMEAVIGPRGFFSRWNVQLVEEWLYLKVTTAGEPVTAIDGVWRKPYEILLIGRAPLDPLQTVTPIVAGNDGIPVVKRRVIIAVPDLHSRKPCLKGLVERWLGLRSGEYQALEVFARYAIGGWWVWGDEALKFSHVEQWVDQVNEGEERATGC